MAAKRPWQVDYLVYLTVRCVVCLVQMLTWNRAAQLAELLGRFAYRIDRRHRLVAADNLRHAFPEKTETEIDALVRACYRHWTRVVVEMIRLPRTLRASNLFDHVSYPHPGHRVLAEYLSMNMRPMMLVTGHFGNFEVLSYALGLHGDVGAVIARRLDNPYLDRFLRQFRQGTGQQILDKNLDYELILRQLVAGGRLGMVGDQDAGARGLFVDFFGRPASTFKSIALLSLEYNAPIAVMGAARAPGEMQFALYLEDVIYPWDYAAHPDAVRVTQRYTAALERMVRRHPEQYFWLHRRWKHLPVTRKAKRVA
ncbi:MAG: hypothetical protein U0797_01535 [Gemmataceae bacterium]